MKKQQFIAQLKSFLPKKGLQNKQALEFVKFIQSKEAQKIWKKHAWNEVE
ncbi:major antigenic peptide PEB2 Cj0778 [Campylobacter coli RM2228]|nr:major antigenic peptide PEB2 Cj0778 [Campylobacter coli RM2228]